MASTIQGDVYVQGNLSARTMKVPDGAVTNAAIAQGAGIEADKVVHQFPLHYGQPAGQDVAAATAGLHIVNGSSGQVVDVEAVALAVPAGGGKAVSIDIKRSRNGGAFATILSAPIAINAASTVRVPIAANVASADLVAGDVLEAVVTTSGSTGTQAQGLLVTVTISEAPE